MTVGEQIIRIFCPQKQFDPLLNNKLKFGRWLWLSGKSGFVSDTISPHFKSSHRQNLCTLSTVVKDKNKYKRSKEWSNKTGR